MFFNSPPLRDLFGGDIVANLWGPYTVPDLWRGGSSLRSLLVRFRYGMEWGKSLLEQRIRGGINCYQFTVAPKTTKSKLPQRHQHGRWPLPGSFPGGYYMGRTFLRNYLANILQVPHLGALPKRPSRSELLLEPIRALSLVLRSGVLLSHHIHGSMNNR